MKQSQALDVLKLGHNVFITGPAGSGKTYVLNQYIAYLKKHNKGVAITASTGIAATHIGGITIHSWSGLGIKEQLSSHDLRVMLKKAYLKKRFKSTNVLIIDEVSMLHGWQFDLINTICKTFKENKEAFGGMQVICSGDFFQLPPVSVGNESLFVFQSNAWQEMELKVCYINEQHRQTNDQLLEMLNYIRLGKSKEAMLIVQTRLTSDEKVSITKLYTHNVDVDRINNEYLAQLPGETRLYRMTSRGNHQIIEILKKGCLAPEILSLKKEAKVIFVKNNFEQGYINGTLGTVVGYTSGKNPIVEIASGKRIEVNLEEWRIEEDGEIKASVQQMPLRLAWAITIHKSQGMTLDSAEMDLSKSFVPGMGYVALSRVRTLDGLYIKGVNDMALQVNGAVAHYDNYLQQQSQAVAQDIEKISSYDREAWYKEFLNSLSEMVPEDKKEKILTINQTRACLEKKLSIPAIARQRGVMTQTIIGHLETIAERDGIEELRYLCPPKQLLEKIKLAFLKTRDWQLAPVKKILGSSYSYDDIALARIFLQLDPDHRQDV